MSSNDFLEADVYPHVYGLIGTVRTDFDDIMDCLTTLRRGFDEYLSDASEDDIERYSKQKDGKFEFVFNETSDEDDICDKESEEDVYAPQDGSLDEEEWFDEDKIGELATMDCRSWKAYKKAATPDKAFMIMIQNDQDDAINISLTQKPEGKKWVDSIEVISEVAVILAYWNSFIDFLRKYGLITRADFENLKWV